LANKVFPKIDDEEKDKLKSPANEDMKTITSKENAKKKKKDTVEEMTSVMTKNIN